MPRLWPFKRKDEYDAFAADLRKRAIDLADIGARFEDRPEMFSTPEARRMARRNIDMPAIAGAVFAAIRKRTTALVKPEMVLQIKRGQEWVDEPDDHPALVALREVNEGLTFKQGFGLIGQGKYTSGAAFWVKRRNGLSVPVEFEIWPPHEVEIIPDKRKSWVAERFLRHLLNGSQESVAMADMIPFRHMVDPRNPLLSLSPIGAIRLELDTGIEARRYNRAHFENALMIGRLFTAGGDEGAISPADRARIEKELQAKFQGTDNAHRSGIISGELKPLEQGGPTHKDMEFLAQQQRVDDVVCQVFDVPPEILGLGNRTYENMPGALKVFWQSIADDFDLIMEELTEFYIRPDFGPEYRLIGRYDNIPALQADRKLQAEIDEINLKGGKNYINELRDRDGEEPVEWGDVPLLPTTIAPLGSAPPLIVPPRGEYVRAKKGDMEGGWKGRLSTELRLISEHLAKAYRGIDIGDVDDYDWNWERKYGKEVAAELEIAFHAALVDAGFIEGGTVTAQEMAAKYAKMRGTELLKLTGDESVTKVTKKWIKGLVSQTIEQGESLQTLQKHLKTGFGFSKSRAETIARTETSIANGRATLTSYKNQGHEGKSWETAHDENVCEICRTGEADGKISVDKVFSNGKDTTPGHPRCRCTLLPVREMPRVAAYAGSGNGQTP